MKISPRVWGILGDGLTRRLSADLHPFARAWAFQAILPPERHPTALRHQVSSHLRAIDVEEQLSRLKTLQLQGRWLEYGPV